MSAETQTFRLVTRSDFDGLVTAVLLKKLNLIDDILFVHPKDVQDGVVAITSRDITTNLPYNEQCHLAIDHHLSESVRVDSARHNFVNDPSAPSAARVVFTHFGGEATFGTQFDEMLAAVDQADSAQYSAEDIFSPKRWVLLNYLTDPRTGLGRFREFRISNYQLMMALVDHLAAKSIDEILELPDVKERSDIYFAHNDRFQAQLKHCTVVNGKVAVLDLRNEDVIHPGNRFALYVLFPDCHTSIHVMWGKQKQNVILAVGKSITNRTSKADIGTLLLKYGGGGHANAGTCQVAVDQVDAVLEELFPLLNQ